MKQGQRNQIERFIKSASNALAIAATIVACAGTKALAESEFLNRGIDAYNHGNYSDAMGMFGAAKSTESDNPTMHYYMANCLLKLGSKNDAIREYKMALAISPTGKLAQYCTAALRSLGALPAVPVVGGQSGSVAAVPAAVQTPSQIADQERASRQHKPKFLEGSQQPQVVSILCGCPLCHRVDMILTDLHTNYGDKVGFIRTMQNAPDEKTRDILSQYRIKQCPTVLLFDSHGQLSHTYAGVISEADMTRDVSLMAQYSPSSQFASPQDAHLAGIRNSVVSEVDARVAADQLRVDDEILKIQNEMAEQITDLPRYRHYKGNTQDMQRLKSAWGADTNSDVAEIEQSGNARIKVIQDEFEKKKRDWYKAAEEKIRALQSTQTSVSNH